MAQQIAQAEIAFELRRTGPASNEGIALKHLDRFTDSTGLIQPAIYGVPRRASGYTPDDNARALRLCARLWRRHSDDCKLSLAAVYLSSLERARYPWHLPQDRVGFSEPFAWTFQ